jgi:hypothetical protein
MEPGRRLLTPPSAANSINKNQRSPHRSRFFSTAAVIFVLRETVDGGRAEEAAVRHSK